MGVCRVGLPVQIAICWERIEILRPLVVYKIGDVTPLVGRESDDRYEGIIWCGVGSWFRGLGKKQKLFFCFICFFWYF